MKAKETSLNILYFILIINLVFFLPPIFGSLYGQEKNNLAKTNIIEVLQNIPDTMRFELTNNFRACFDEIMLDIKKNKGKLLNNNYHINGAEYESYIDTNYTLFSIQNKSSDSEPKIQFKLFNMDSYFILGVNSNYYDCINTTTKMISFYKINKKSYSIICYNKAFNDINFYNNYPDIIKNIIIQCSFDYINSCSNKKSHFHYSFTDSDTIRICEPWAEHPLVNHHDEKKYEEITTYLEQDVKFISSDYEYCQKYIFRNGVLEPLIDY